MSRSPKTITFAVFACLLIGIGRGVAAPMNPVLVGELAGFPLRMLAICGSQVYAIGDDPLDYDTTNKCPTRNALEVWDVSTPAAPVRIGVLRLDAVVLDIAAADGVIYLAAEGGDLITVDATDPSAPEMHDRWAGAARWVTAHGSHLYVSDYSAGLRIYDISSPLSPNLVGTVPCGGTPYKRVAVEGDYAYAIVPGAFAVIDVSNPAAAEEIARLVELDGPTGEEMAIGGGRAYICGYYPGTVDISTPADPQYMGRNESFEDLRDWVLVGTHLYACAEQDGLYTIDPLSGAPAEWVREPTEVPGCTYDVAASGSFVYVAAYEGGLRVFDVSSGAPVSVWGRGAPAFAHAIDVQAGLAGMAHWHGDGLGIYDIFDPTDPCFLSSAVTGAFGASVSLCDDIAFFTSVGTESLYGAYDISNPAHPELLWSEGAEATSVSADEHYAYVSTAPGLRVWSLADPTAPVARGSCALSTPPYDIEIRGDVLYATAIASPFTVLDVSNRSRPLVLAEAGSPTSTCAVEVAGHFAFVSAWDSLHIFAISNPDTPVEVSSFTPETGTVEALAVLGSYLYIADPHFGLRIIGVSDPVHPVLAGEVAIPFGTGSSSATPFGTCGVAAQGNHVYVSVFGWGLMLFQVASTFLDVPLDHWAADAIERCYRAGIVQGFTATTYMPSAPVDRAQMATYISRAMSGGDAGVPDPASGTRTFSDVDAEHWAYKYVEYAAAEEVVTGYDDGLYHPEDSVDRGQMAVFVARSRGWVALDDDMTTAPELFPDVPAGYWAGTAIEACVTNGVVQGYADGLYRPETVVTRDQMAVYIARAFELTY